MYIHLRQQLKLYSKYTFISTSMIFINANELSMTLIACVLTFNSINGWTIAPLDNQTESNTTWFMNHAVVRHCVFVDKCGYNIWTARSYGKARQDLCFPQQLLAEWMPRVSITSWHRRGRIWIPTRRWSLCMTGHRPPKPGHSRPKHRA